MKNITLNSLFVFSSAKGRQLILEFWKSTQPRITQLSASRKLYNLYVSRAMQPFQEAMLNCVPYHGVSAVIFFKTMYNELKQLLDLVFVTSRIIKVSMITLNSTLNIT